MVDLGLVLFVAGCLVAIFGHVWLLTEAFRQDALWGLCCLLIPFVWIAFLAKHWHRAARPFLIYLAGSMSLLLGYAMTAG